MGPVLLFWKSYMALGASLLMDWKTSTMDSCLRFFLPWLIHKIKTQGASLVIVNDPPTLSSCNQWQMLGQGKLSSLLVTDVKLGTLVSSDCGGRKQTKVHDNTNTYLINFISFHSFCSPLYPSNGQISELSK